MDEEKTTDVVIIGGGLSGLAAAYKLKNEGKKVVLLEAKGRLGGRTCTLQTPMGNVDVGGEFIGKDQSQPIVQSYVKKFGLEKTLVDTFPKNDPTKWVYLDKDNSRTDLDPSEIPGKGATIKAIGELEALVNLVDPANPETRDPQLVAFDAMTIRQWVEEKSGWTQITKDAFYASIRDVLSIEPDDASFYFFLYYAKTSGGFTKLIDTSGNGGQDQRFVNGTSDLVMAFAEGITDQTRAGIEERMGTAGPVELGSENASIVLGARVSSVRSGTGGADVTVARSDGTTVTYHADQVIAALPPWAFGLSSSERHPCKGKIENPPAPIAVTFDDGKDQESYERRQRLCGAMRHGMSWKAFVQFERPFWRDRGLCGRALCADSTSPVSWTIHSPNEWLMENGRPQGAAPHVMLVFMAGDAVRDLKEKGVGEEDRKRIVLGKLQELFGDLPEPLAYKDHFMPGPAGVLAPEVLSKVGSALRTPIGRVHWASTETATSWCGYMEGAIQAGERAADEL